MGVQGVGAYPGLDGTLGQKEAWRAQLMRCAGDLPSGRVQGHALARLVLHAGSACQCNAPDVRSFKLPPLLAEGPAGFASRCICGQR